MEAIWRWEEAVPHRPLPAVAATLGTHHREYVVLRAPEPATTYCISEAGQGCRCIPVPLRQALEGPTWTSRAHRRSPCASPWPGPHRCSAGAHCPCPQGKSAPRPGSRRFSGPLEPPKSKPRGPSEPSSTRDPRISANTSPMQGKTTSVCGLMWRALQAGHHFGKNVKPRPYMSLRDSNHLTTHCQQLVHMKSC